MKSIILAVVLTATALAPMPAWAGVYGDDVTRCLAKSTSDGDKLSLVKWIFMSMAAHPAIKQYANISPEQRAQVDAEVGAIIVKRLTKSCRTETIAALKYEGTGFLENSFSSLGQIAMAGLTTDPQVGMALSNWTKNADLSPITELGKEAGRPMPSQSGQ